MTLIDVHGNPHKITREHVNSMISIGWVAFFFAWMMNILYYMVHPSDLDFCPRRFRSQKAKLCLLPHLSYPRDKLFIHICGKKRFLLTSWKKTFFSCFLKKYCQKGRHTLVDLDIEFIRRRKLDFSV